MASDDDPEFRARLQELRESGTDLSKEDEDLLVRLRLKLLSRGPFGYADQSNGRCACECADAHNPECGAHGFGVLALRKRYGVHHGGE